MKGEAEVVFLMTSGIAHGFYFTDEKEAETIYEKFRTMDLEMVDQLIEVGEGKVCINPKHIESVRFVKEIPVTDKEEKVDKKPRYTIAGYG